MMKALQNKKQLLLLIVLLIGIVFLNAGLSHAFSSVNSSEEHESNGWFALFSKLLNFSLLVFILYYFFVKVIDLPGIYKKTSHDIIQSIKSAEDSTKSAHIQIEEIKLKLANLETEIAQIKEDAIKITENEKDRILAEAEIETKRIQEMASREIEWKMKEAIQRVKMNTLNAALSISEDLLKKQFKNEDQERLINKFISDMKNTN